MSSVSASGLVEQLVQVQLNQEKIDARSTKAAGAHRHPAGRSTAPSWKTPRPRSRPAAQNTISSSKTSAIPCPTQSWAESSEVGSAVEVVREQAEALLQSVNNLIAVVNEPEMQQALIEVQDGLQRVLDKFNSTGMRDIDSLIEIVSELRDITDKLTSALQTLQNRLEPSWRRRHDGAADLADELQVQDSLNVIYKTLEDHHQGHGQRARPDEPVLQSAGQLYPAAAGAYMQFTEAREKLNEYEKQLATPRPSTRPPRKRPLPAPMWPSSWISRPLPSSSTPRTSPCPPVTSRTKAASRGC